jgi:uncharacterized membrane protein YhhN
MKRSALIAFILASIGELLAGILNSETLHFICKPLIMICLGIYYHSSVSGEDRSSAVLVAIFFSLVGDVLLMLQGSNPQFFVFGLAAFLVAHVFYIFAYRQHHLESHVDELQGVQRIRLAFPVILAGSGLIFVLYPSLSALRIPVILYAIVIVIMVLTALFRYGRTNAKSYWMVFIGAVLFMISDSTIAINKFLSPVRGAEFIVMSTYIAAQVLIVDGLIRHHSKRSIVRFKSL